MPVVNDVVLCTSKFVKRVDLLSRVLRANKQNQRSMQKKSPRLIDVYGLIVVTISRAYAYAQTRRMVVCAATWVSITPKKAVCKESVRVDEYERACGHAHACACSCSETKWMIQDYLSLSSIYFSSPPR